MKVYQVECWALITLAAQDMEKAALDGPALIRDNPDLLLVRAVHETDFEPVWKDFSLKNAQEDDMVTTPAMALAF